MDVYLMIERRIERRDLQGECMRIRTECQPLEIRKYNGGMWSRIVFTPHDHSLIQWLFVVCLFVCLRLYVEIHFGLRVRGWEGLTGAKRWGRLEKEVAGMAFKNAQ